MTSTSQKTIVQSPHEPIKCPRHFTSQPDRRNCHHRQNQQQSQKQPSTMSHWKKETKLFCQSTSIRGIPHIMRARSAMIRRMWIGFVLTLIVGWSVSMIFLLRQYLEFNVIHPPQVLRDVNSPFPSVTVCNLRPISPDGERKMMREGLKTPREFATDANKLGSLMIPRRRQDYRIFTGTFNMATYLESLPANVSQQDLGYTHSNLVIKCLITYIRGSKRTAIRCNGNRHKLGGTWRHFVHAQYLNCYTLDFDPELKNNITALEIFLYLSDNMNTSNCIDCFMNEIKSQSSGAVFAVHTPGTYPNINSKGINVSPGSLTEITLKNALNIQKSPPYGHCSIDTPEHLQMYGYKISYSEFACRQLKIQADINNQCGCKAIEYPISQENLPFCSSLPSFTIKGSCDKQDFKSLECWRQINTTIERLKCKLDIIKKYNKDVVETCTLPCSFYSYETDRSISNWPTKLFQIQWLKSSLAKHLKFLDREEFEPYRQVIKLQKQNQHREANKLLYNTNVLERNLLALLINRPNFNLHKIEEKEVLSLTSFLSQSGGLFSIWLGLTMISIVEVIELFIHCCGGPAKNKGSSNATTTVKNESCNNHKGVKNTKNRAATKGAANGEREIYETLDVEDDTSVRQLKC